MKQRIITGIIMFAILLPLVFIENQVCEILYAILSVFMCTVGAYEFSSKRVSNKKVNPLVLIFSGLLGFSCLNATYQMQSGIYYYHLFTLMLFSLFAFILMGIGVFSKETDQKDMVNNVFCVLYTGMMLGYAMSLRYFSPVNLSHIFNLGNKCFLFVYLIGVLTDSFAYMFGIKFGKHKLIPSVSPKKSTEGAIFGLVGGGLGGIIGLFAFNILKSKDNLLISVLICFGLSIIISMIAQLGDLVESKLKRNFNVKDFGNILPGHGGILDRFDSYIYSGFFVLIVFTFIELILAI